MIRVTKINNIEILLNSDLIETIEQTPNTVLTMVNGKKIIVKETSHEVYDRIIDFRSKIYSNRT